jgi:hypothetical protein
LLVEEDIEALVVTIDVEIKEIEKSIVDFKEEVGFDYLWSSQLCQSFLVK